MTDTERDAAVRAVTAERFGPAPEERTDDAGRKAFLEQIRTLIDWFTAHPEWPVPASMQMVSYAPRDVVTSLAVCGAGGVDKHGYAWAAAYPPRRDGQPMVALYLSEKGAAGDE